MSVHNVLNGPPLKGPPGDSLLSSEVIQPSGPGEGGPKLADRHNLGKPELSYMLDFPRAMQGLAEVCAFGAAKYSRNNWKKGFIFESLLDSMLRHLLAAADSHNSGESRLDAESGLDHLHHVVWNALVLAEQFGELTTHSLRNKVHKE